MVALLAMESVIDTTYYEEILISLRPRGAANLGCSRLSGSLFARKRSFRPPDVTGLFRIDEETA